MWVYVGELRLVFHEGGGLCLPSGFLWSDGYIRMRYAENGTVGGGFYHHWRVGRGHWKKDIKYCEQAIEEG